MTGQLGSEQQAQAAGRPGHLTADVVGLSPSPCAALDRIRPDIWVKGGDYDGRDLPEAALLENWGGVAVTVPYLSGRSTTRLHAAQVDGADRA